MSHDRQFVSLDGRVNNNLFKIPSERRTEADFESNPEHRETNENYAPTGYDNYYGDYIGYTKVIHRDNMELYTLLGGLSFASLLATTLILLSRRNGTLLRSSSNDLFSRKGEGQSSDHEMVIKVPHFLYRFGRHFTRPWWSSSSEERKAKGLQPISLIHPELVNNWIKVFADFYDIHDWISGDKCNFYSPTG